VYVRACVIRNDRMRQPSYDVSEGSIDLDLAQRALGCNIHLFSSRSLESPLEASLSSPSTLFLLSLCYPFLLNLLFRDVFSNLTLSQLPTPDSTNRTLILCSFHFLDIMNFPK